MDSIMTKAELLEQFRQEQAAWEALLADVTPARMEIPNSLDEWTFKDTVAHLTTWWRWHVGRLADVRRGNDPTDHPTQDNVQVINRWIYFTNRDRPLDDVLDDAAAAWQAFEDGLQALDEHVLFTPDQVASPDGKAFGPTELQNFVRHLHEEHEPEIREWLSKLQISGN
jgi:hypothetical protein